jgi:hypothetical protein
MPTDESQASDPIQEDTLVSPMPGNEWLVLAAVLPACGVTERKVWLETAALIVFPRPGSA